MLIRQLPITGNSRSAASHGKTKHPKSVTPANTERVTPANTERVTPANTERVAPANTERVTQANTERVTPANTERVTPANTERVAPANTERVAPANTERVAQANTERVAQANTERVTQANTERVAQANTERVAPGYTERNRTRRIKPAKSKSTSKVYIGGVDCSNSPADIVSEVAEFGITQSDIKVEELRQKDDWQSFCVTIPKEAEDKVRDLSKWPSRITVRPFRGDYYVTPASKPRAQKPKAHTNTHKPENQKYRGRKHQHHQRVRSDHGYQYDRYSDSRSRRDQSRYTRGGRPESIPKRRTTTTTPRMGAMMMTTTTYNTPGTLTPGTTTTPTMTTDVPGMDSDANGMNIRIMSFNCYGLKSSLLSVCEWMNELDILFASETWLTQCDTIHMSNKLRELDYWTSLKSSIDPETVLDGRPYGGVGLICRNIPGVSFVPINCSNDRVCAMKLVSDPKVLLTVIGVYMPYYNGTTDHTIVYHETLDDVQCLIDANEQSPIMFLGDMNASLPQSSIVSHNWNKRHPFTRHSLMLYDFICDDDLYRCNFDYDQHVHFKGRVYQYLIH